jgi:molybdopterin synthase catalytic subunit
MRIVFSAEKDEKTVFLREENGEIVCEATGLRIRSSANLERILNALAALGYETAVIERDSDVFKNLIGEVKTLQELLEEVKSEKNSELCGAIGIFIGFVRKISGGKEVVRLEYEAYEPLFSEKLSEIEGRIKELPGVEGVRIFHKIGSVKPKEDIVYVVVMARHRKDLWGPLAESMEIIKRELPVWKKEVYSEGEIWVHDLEKK